MSILLEVSNITIQTEFKFEFTWRHFCIRHPNKSCECKKIAEFTFFIVDILDLHDMMDHKSVSAFKGFGDYSLYSVKSVLHEINISFNKHISTYKTRNVYCFSYSFHLLNKSYKQSVNNFIKLLSRY